MNLIESKILIGNHMKEWDENSIGLIKTINREKFERAKRVEVSKLEKKYYELLSVLKSLLHNKNLLELWMQSVQEEKALAEDINMQTGQDSDIVKNREKILSLKRGMKALMMDHKKVDQKVYELSSHLESIFREINEIKSRSEMSKGGEGAYPFHINDHKLEAV